MTWTTINSHNKGALWKHIETTSSFLHMLKEQFVYLFSVFLHLMLSSPDVSSPQVELKVLIDYCFLPLSVSLPSSFYLSSSLLRMQCSSTTPSSTTFSTGTSTPRQRRCTRWHGWQGSTMPSLGCPTDTTLRSARGDSNCQVGQTHSGRERGLKNLPV